MYVGMYMYLPHESMKKQAMGNDKKVKKDVNEWPVCCRNMREQASLVLSTQVYVHAHT